MHQPDFWFRERSLASTLLLPLSALWWLGHKLSVRHSVRRTVGVPVVSVGNLSIGGTGKTPLTIALAQELKHNGHIPHIVARGYGGSLIGPVRVDSKEHRVKDVGDEPLLLSAFAPTWVAKNRFLGAAEAQKNGATAVIMDDGHQNRHLEPDCAIIVADSTEGFGNQRMVPAGPLREPIRSGLARAKCVVSVGTEEKCSSFEESFETRHGLPLIRGILRPLSSGLDLNGANVIGFAGIGNPEKFRKTLVQLGTRLVKFFPLSDHQVPSEMLLSRIEQAAKEHNAMLVTTEKDAVRLDSKWKAKVLTVPVRLKIDTWGRLHQCLEETGLQLLNEGWQKNA